MSKFNMGCGNNKREGYINVDAYAECNPDVQFNLESFPWPWEASSAEEVLFNHSLEHMGQNPQVFLSIMTELYRICANDALVYINVPHPRHDFFLGDPTHVRPITPELLSLFDKEECDRWKNMGASNTPFAHYLNVNFKRVSMTSSLDEPFKTQFIEHRITSQELYDLALKHNNIYTEYRFVLKVIK